MVTRHPFRRLFEKPDADRRSGLADTVPAQEPRPLPGFGFTPLTRGPHRWRLLETVAVTAVAVIVLLRVVMSTLTRPASLGEARLVEALTATTGSTGAPAGLTEALARAQFLGYVGVTGALDRHVEVLDAVREPALVACGVLLAALVVLGVRLRPSPAVVALGLALLACWGQAIAALGTAGPGLVGVAWAAVGGVLLTWSHAAPRSVGLVALVVAIGTAPLLAVPVAIAVAVATARRWVPTAEVALALGTAAPVLVLLSEPVPADAGPRVVVPLVAAVVVVLGLAGAVPRRSLRLPAAVAAGNLVLVALPWSASTLLLPALVVSVVVLAVAGLDVLAGLADPILERARTRIVPAVVLLGCGVAAVLLVPGLSTVGSDGPPPAPPVIAGPRQDLAAWIIASTDPATTVTVPDDVRPDLLRAGVPPARLAPGGAVVVRSGELRAADVLARFGSGDDAISAVSSDPSVASAPGSERRTRAAAGAQLADNPSLTVPADVADLLRTGDADTRALAMLTGLAGRGPVTVTALAALPGDDPGLPRRQVVLADVGASTLTWLAAQRPPFRPVVETTPAGTTLTWPVPGPAALLGR